MLRPPAALLSAAWRAEDDGVDVVEAAAAPSADVLPTRVRRRLSRRDAWLPLVLTGELLAGMLLGMAYHVAAAVPAGPPTGGPVVAVDASAADASASDTPAPDAADGSRTETVLPSPAAAAPAPVPTRAEPRNPFAMQLG